MKAGADEESKVGGMRMLILNLSYGSMTLPALATSGNPLRPMTVSWGRQVLLSYNSKGFSDTKCSPSVFLISYGYSLSSCAKL